MKCILGLLALLTVSAWTEAGVVKRESDDIHNLTVTEQLVRANEGLGIKRDGIRVIGDIARPHMSNQRNADPCVLRGCKWPRAVDGFVYVPYVIANNYSVEQLSVIMSALNSFSVSTCIRFIPRVNHVDYIHIRSLSGCYSYVGRQGKAQTLSLHSWGCIYFGSVQHELLHALGFNHEQCRSDRDDHIQILLDNALEENQHNFRKIATLNQGTPYEYNSVMHYGRLAFSKDKVSPTMEDNSPEVKCWPQDEDREKVVHLEIIGQTLLDEAGVMEQRQGRRAGTPPAPLLWDWGSACWNIPQV